MRGGRGGGGDNVVCCGRRVDPFSVFFLRSLFTFASLFFISSPSFPPGVLGRTEEKQEVNGEGEMM